MDLYSREAKKVNPKVLKLKQLDGELKAANDKLAGKKNELQAVLDRVALTLTLTLTLTNPHPNPHPNPNPRCSTG